MLTVLEARVREPNVAPCSYKCESDVMPLAIDSVKRVVVFS